MILGSIITFLACSLVASIVEVARTRAALHDEQSLLREYRMRSLRQERLVINALRRLEGLGEIPLVDHKLLDWNAAARESAGLGLTTIPIGNSGGSLSFSGEDAEWITKSALDATKIGDVKLHNCALTPADIEADFEREYGTPCDIRGPNVKSGTMGGSWE
jgi:hypothetical protein